MTEQLPLRGIDVTGREKVAPDPDQPYPVLDWTPIAKMVVDDRYQRPLNERIWAAIHKIAANFRWSRFGAVMGAPTEGGLFAIIDGQHRVHAAALCGIAKVPTITVTIPPSEQARAFEQINSTAIRVNEWQKYRAALVARDPVAIAARDAVDAAGCELMTSNRATRDQRAGQIYAIGRILKLVQAGHGPAITTVLSAIRLYDRNDRVGLYSDYVLAPMITLAIQRPEMTAEQLAGLMSWRDPFKMIERLKVSAANERQPVGAYVVRGLNVALGQYLEARVAAQ